MISASFQPDPGQLTAALTRRAEAIAEEAAREAQNNRDNTAMWRDARLLWPAFTTQAADQG